MSNSITHDTHSSHSSSKSAESETPALMRDVNSGLTKSSKTILGAVGGIVVIVTAGFALIPLGIGYAIYKAMTPNHEFAPLVSQEQEDVNTDFELTDTNIVIAHPQRLTPV